MIQHMVLALGPYYTDPVHCIVTVDYDLQHRLLPRACAL